MRPVLDTSNFTQAFFENSSKKWCANKAKKTNGQGSYTYIDTNALKTVAWESSAYESSAYESSAYESIAYESSAYEIGAFEAAAEKVGRAWRVRFRLPGQTQVCALYNGAIDVGSLEGQISVCEWATYSAFVKDQVVTKNIKFLCAAR